MSRSDKHHPLLANADSPFFSVTTCISFEMVASLAAWILLVDYVEPTMYMYMSKKYIFAV